MISTFLLSFSERRTLGEGWTGSSQSKSSASAWSNQSRLFHAILPPAVSARRSSLRETAKTLRKSRAWKEGRTYRCVLLCACPSLFPAFDLLPPTHLFFTKKWLSNLPGARSVKAFARRRGVSALRRSVLRLSQYDRGPAKQPSWTFLFLLFLTMTCTYVFHSLLAFRVLVLGFSNESAHALFPLASNAFKHKCGRRGNFRYS